MNLNIINTRKDALSVSYVIDKKIKHYGIRFVRGGCFDVALFPAQALGLTIFINSSFIRYERERETYNLWKRKQKPLISKK